MKLLLTSAGITNDSIAKALFELVGKKPEDTTVVFIPTASNIIS
jgi:peptidase E